MNSHSAHNGPMTGWEGGGGGVTKLCNCGRVWHVKLPCYYLIAMAEGGGGGPDNCNKRCCSNRRSIEKINFSRNCMENTL